MTTERRSEMWAKVTAAAKAGSLTLYRFRGPAFYAATVILIANIAVLQLPLPRVAKRAWAILVLAALVTLLISLALSALVPRWIPEALLAPTTTVHPPVEGRWLALNSPATAVPSHGTREYGQAYAIDLVYEEAGTTRPTFGERAMRPAAEYPAFGKPVLAMIDGTVVRASSWRRDHRARSSTFGFVYLMVEAFVRQLGGPNAIVGNHVTIRSDDGIYAAVGHLKRGSVTVSVGDRITAGTHIGDCGNSGNSSEPHVHAQLMDRVSFWTAQGRPMAFSGVTVEGGTAPGDAATGDAATGAAAPGDAAPTDGVTSADGIPSNGHFLVASLTRH